MPVITLLKKFLLALGIQPFHVRAVAQHWVAVLHDLVKYRTYPMFRDVVIEMGAQCNRRCAMCPVSIEPRMTESYLSDALYEKVLRELAAIRFSGRLAFHMFNEPLLDKNIVSKVGTAARLVPRAKLTFNTNGDYLTAPLLRELKTAGLFSMLVTAYTESAYARLWKLYAELEESEKAVMTLRRAPDFVENRAGLLKVQEIAEPVKADCFLPSSQCVINYKGEVVICCSDYFAQHTVGNVATENIMAIWRGERMQDVRRILRRKERSKLETCRACNLVATPYDMHALLPGEVGDFNRKQ